MEFNSELLADPVWRLHHLYEVRPTDGVVRAFVPNTMQARIIDDVYVRGYKRLLIPKSRRYGCSTLLGIMMVDCIAFQSGIKDALVDLTQPNAIEKLNSIMALAAESLMRKIPGVWEMELVKGRLSLKAKGKDASHIFAGKSFRGDGVAFAHISEIGAIAASEPSRALEIRNSTLPAAKDGVIVIETTVRGGKKGVFWELVSGALEMKEEFKGEKDWRVLFLPWWQDGNNVSDGIEPLSEATVEYFNKLRVQTGRDFTLEQMRWWQREKRNFGFTMGEEYPSTIEEAFEVPQGGAILAGAFDRAVEDGRVRRVEYDASRPCWSVWDLGAPKNTICYVFQLVDGEKRILDADCGFDGETPALRVARVLRKFPTLSVSILPHDADYPTHTGLCQAQAWRDAGLPGIRVVPKTNDRWIGLNYLVSTFGSYVFDDEGTERARMMAKSYRMVPRLGEDGKYKSEIVHDESSHWADPLRMIAEAEKHGMLGNERAASAEKKVGATFGKRFSGRNRGRDIGKNRGRR